MKFHRLLTGFIISLMLVSVTHAKSLAPLLPSGEPATNYAVRIYYGDEATRRKITVTFEPLEADPAKDYVVVEVDPQTHGKLKKLGLKVRVDKAFTEKMNQPPAPLFKSSAAVRSLKAAAATIPGYSCYRTVEETFNTMDGIVAAHPNLATVVDAGDSWEKANGQGGYDLKVLVLTNAATPGPKPKAFITSSIHAREYTPAELMTRFAEYLVNNYGSDADITWLLDNQEVHLMLQTNPDGRKQAETGLSWRKNTDQLYCGATSNTRGADLNRNFDFQWNCCGGSSSNECSLTYHGASAASEPETQAVQNYLRNLFPDVRGPGLNDAAPLNAAGLYLDIHSYSELILWPWGFTNSPAPNGVQLQTLGRKFAFFNAYYPQQSIGLYPTDGTTGSFAYGDLGVAAYTFELGTAFFQDCGTFENTILPANFPALIYALKASRAPYQLPAGPEVVNVDLDAGDSFPVPAGTFVTLSASADDGRYSNANGSEPSQAIASAEYYLDTPPWTTGATAIPMTASDGSFNSSTEGLQASIDTSSLSEGRHTVYVRAQDADGNQGVVSAVFLNIDNSVTLPTIIFEDDFETDKGWITNPDGADTATTGQWQRANPEPTNYNGPKQLGDTVSGVNDLVTGATAGSSVGVNDIDNGITSIRSPDIAIPAGGPFTLSFAYYLAHTSNSSADDFLRVSVVGNSTSVALQEVGDGADDDGAWQTASFNIDAFAGQTIHLLVEAADGANGSIVEAGIDDVKIEGVTSGGNVAPVITNPGNQTNDEGDGVSLQMSASDADGDSLIWSAAGLPTDLSIDAASGQITGTLSNASSGVYNVIITVSDGNLTDDAAFVWTVNNVNQAPTVTSPGNQANNEGDSISLAISGSDPDGDALNWSASGLPSGLSINSATGVISGTLPFNSSGSYNVTVTATDSTLGDSATFTWTVANVNRAPGVVNPGNQASITGDSVSLGITASDPDGDALSYSANGLPAGLAINAASGVISGTLPLNANGVYNVTVTASDGSLSGSTTFTWTVNTANLPPVVTNPGNQVNNEGDAVSLQIVSSDPNGDVLNYSASGLPTGLSINSASGLISGALSTNASGVYNASVTASDGSLSTSVAFAWTVNNVNLPPVVNNPGDQNSNEGDAINLAVSASDPDGNTLAYLATGLPTGLTIDANTGVISGILPTGANGAYNVAVTVTDGSLSDTATFNWTVSAVSASAWMETVVINNVDSSGWTTVSLAKSYASMVVACTVNYANNNVPEVVRMQNVSGNSFQIKLQNPGNASLNGETIHCLVMEEGAWTLPDGRAVEAKKVPSTVTDRRGSWKGQSFSAQTAFTTPVVLGQVMSYNDVDWSVFWSRGTSRTAPASASAIYVGKNVAEDTNKTRANETLGVIIMEAGTGSANGIAYEAKRGADIIRGPLQSATSYAFAQNYAATPAFAVASQTAMDGGNGGWAILRGANPLASGNITLAIDEDQIRDSERWHTTEQVDYAVFESLTALPLTPAP